MMNRFESKCILLAGASALALSVGVPSAVAQEGEQRTLGTVLVTTQKTEESIQDVPIAVSAFDEAALEKLQLAGGPDLVKSIPNVSFTKGNFAGYNFKIRGIGNDAVAQSSDAGVGVHQNDVPLTANRLFEAEFYDVERVETLRGPQGTLYGRNATGGVVNVITAKPVLEEFQANARLTYGNYNTFKAKGMINVPLGETAALRLAGSALQRDGYADNVITGNDIDDRDLWSIRGTFAWEPTDRLRAWVMYEHFEEDDNRQRQGKQLCSKDPFKTEFQGIPIGPADIVPTTLGCREAPLSDSFDRVNSAGTLGGGFAALAGLASGDLNTDPLIRDLRTIEAFFDPIYQAESTLFTVNASYDITDSLTVTYLGSLMEDSVVSITDYNKLAPSQPFNEVGAPFGVEALIPIYQQLFPGGVVSDPQLGASNELRTYDISGGDSEQITHEIRLQSDFDGRFNFNLGAIYVDFEAIDPNTLTDGYYVLSNSLTATAQIHNALVAIGQPGPLGFNFPIPIDTTGDGMGSILSNLGGDGGNYFRSLSPYRLESTAIFGEGYFDLTDDLQLTVGLRYTDDQKEQDRIATFLFTPALFIPEGGPLQPTPLPGNAPDDAGDGTYNVDFQEVTGRIVLDWSPDLTFTDDTLIFGSYSRGYKGGGINPPQPAGADLFPQTFDPEFINAYEIGTKNTLDGGAVQLNATGFFYDYEGYQITQIINRTSANFNIDAELTGLEIETIWNPASTLVLNANLGLLDTKIVDTFGVDVLNRTKNRDDLVTIKGVPSFANCVITAQGYATVLGAIQAGAAPPGATQGLCSGAFASGVAEAAVGDPDDGITGTGDLAQDIAIAEAAFGLTGVMVSYVDSNGETQMVSALTPFDGDAFDLDGNSIPGAPEITLNFGAEYTWEELGDSPWNLTGRIDYYYQGDSFSRVWNTGRDELDSWDNLNLTLRLENPDTGLFIEAFGKNVTDEEVITGAYLTDDSSGLFTNIFLTEPQTYGISIGKSW